METEYGDYIYYTIFDEKDETFGVEITDKEGLTVHEIRGMNSERNAILAAKDWMDEQEHNN